MLAWGFAERYHHWIRLRREHSGGVCGACESEATRGGWTRAWWATFHHFAGRELSGFSGRDPGARAGGKYPPPGREFWRRVFARLGRGSGSPAVPVPAEH